MWYKGVSFTSEQCALVYLVDAAGTRTTTDTFSDLNKVSKLKQKLFYMFNFISKIKFFKDFSIDAFYSESQSGPACIGEATSILSHAQYWITEEGIENWIINNVKISQTPDGLARYVCPNVSYI